VTFPTVFDCSYLKRLVRLTPKNGYLDSFFPPFAVPLRPTSLKPFSGKGWGSYRVSSQTNLVSVASESFRESEPDK
jgi:hypothetical protein